jgi:hypothetical protein
MTSPSNLHPAQSKGGFETPAATKSNTQKKDRLAKALKENLLRRKAVSKPITPAQ